jgi:NAD(P)-dependent dehydrogenase (short-subunit alcohol dehydrogenase family)
VSDSGKMSVISRGGNVAGRLEGKVVAITGGASGFGAATARLAVDEGAKVVLGDIQDERGAAVAASLGAAAIYRHCDVTQEADVAGLVDMAITAFGRLDGMVNNAGIVGAVGPIDETPLDEYEFTIAVLQRSVFLGMKHAARVMKPQRSGGIVSISSVAGITGGLGPHAYAAAKTAVISLTKNVAAELGAFNIRVNAISPGKMATPMNAALVTGDPDETDKTLAYMAKVSPLAGRPGTADDIAEAIVWLLCDQSGFVSGHTLVVDGGLTTGSPEDPAHRPPNRFSTHEPIVREASRRGL